jgi:isochorismate synthase
MVERPPTTTSAAVLLELAQGLRARGAAARGAAARGAAGAAAGEVAIVSASVAASPLDAIALYAAAVAAGLEASFWSRPSTALTLVGIGRAWSVAAAGPDRFTQAAAAWREVCAGLDEEADKAALAGPLAGPRLLGGLGFDGRRPAAGDLWAPFGAASLVLPELLVAQQGGEAWWTASAPVDDADRLATDSDHRYAPLLLAAARDVEAAAAAADRDVDLTAERPDHAEWRRLVAQMAGAVGRGRLDKVVLARRVDVHASSPLDVPVALRRLTATAPQSASYAFHRAGRTFLGATPELLVRTVERDFQSVAIAGSTRRGADAAEDELLSTELRASAKEREEHAVVVRALRERLGSVSERLTIAPEPAVLRLPHVQHLVTDIDGTLREAVGVLALAGRIHPTPAICGEPTELAMTYIREAESFGRGWYSGPVGWVDRDGDGELMVALRCGVVDGRDLSLFAGCGIVADSDPDREWEESRTKLRGLALALGIPATAL